MRRTSHLVRKQLFLLPLLSFLIFGFVSAKPKPKAKEELADPASAIDLPENANMASLRVSAIDTIYELDLSVPQMNAFRQLAAGTAETSSRSPASVSPQFVAALKDFQTALLDAKDDQQIAKLRNQVIDLADGADIHLDNDITTTKAARVKAGAACAELRASQIAAFLAVHAEEVSDPLELMMSTADALQELRAEAADKKNEKTDKATEDAASAQSTIEEASLSVGYLVAGMDDTKAQAVTQQVVQWLRAPEQMSEADFATHRPALEDSAKRMVGGTPPIQVLNNWLEDQMATLLSNPQLSPAIEVLLKRREQAN